MSQGITPAAAAVALVLLGAASSHAQTPAATGSAHAESSSGPAGASAETPAQQPPREAPSAASRAKALIGRWLDLQNATLNLRYRYVDTSTGVVTTNQVQHRETLRGRVKFDAPGHYALNFGLFTGVRFTSGWNNTGWGINDAQKNLAFKALYGSAQPWAGVEAQVGGLYIIKGESTEITTYDEDGYVTGERITIRRPKQLFFDEISATSAYFVGGTGPQNIPVSHRLPHFDEQNYQHYLLDKKIGKRAAVSVDYTRESGRKTWRQAVKISTRELRVFDSIIYERYQRTNVDPDQGFALTAEKLLSRKFTLQGGYASIDPKNGPLNADRFNIGNRAFTMLIYNSGPITASFFITTAVGKNGPLPQRTLSNSVITYNMLPALRRTGLF